LLATVTSSSAKSIPGFEQGYEIDQLAFSAERGSRETEPSACWCRDARLVERRGFDKIAHGLGLRQVDAAIQKGAPR